MQPADDKQGIDFSGFLPSIQNPPRHVQLMVKAFVKKINAELPDGAHAIAVVISPDALGRRSLHIWACRLSVEDIKKTKAALVGALIVGRDGAINMRAIVEEEFAYDMLEVTRRRFLETVISQAETKGLASEAEIVETLSNCN